MPAAYDDVATLSEYWRALGRFVHEFALTEAYLQEFLWREAATTPEVAKSVFSGVRIEQAMSFCRRIWDARGSTERRAEFDRPFAQLNVLNGARNDIIHFGALGVHAGIFLVSNARIAHTKQTLRTMEATPETLENMSEDLGAIQAAFIADTMTTSVGGGPGHSRGVSEARSRAMAIYTASASSSSA